jgi:thymidine kinase
MHEPSPASRPDGRVEVIAGPMFAGKTEELLRRVRRARIEGRRVVVLSHALDTRSGEGRVASHAGLDAASRTVASAADIAGAVPADAELVAVDEAHFFGADLVPAVTELARRGLVVIVAGLDVTFDGRPFEPLPSLMALAERVDKLTAICTVCGADAIFHERVVPSARPGGEIVADHVGGLDKYQARCRRHFAASRPD